MKTPPTVTSLRLLVAALCCTLVPPSLLGAEGDDDNPLPANFAIRLPAFTEATVQARRIRPLSEAELADPIRRSWTPDLVESVTTKDDRALVVRSRWEGEKTSSILVSDGRVVYQPSLRYPEDIQVGGQGAPSFARGDFPKLDWVLRDHYTGVEAVNGRRAYRMVRAHEDKDGRNASAARKRAEQEADARGINDKEFRDTFIAAALANQQRKDVVWIDAKTLLPLRSTDGEMEYAYSYRARPNEKVVPEPALAAALQRALGHAANR